MSLPFATVATAPAPGDLEPLRTAECRFPAVSASVAAARALVRRELAAWGAATLIDATLIDDCALIVSELVTNAVRHAGGTFSVRLGSNGAWVYGEIFDQGPGVPRQRAADFDATDGRGLFIVDELADDWGVATSRGGKTVWFIAGADR